MLFGLERILPRSTPQEFPVAATPDRIDFARAQIEALLPPELIQSYADASYQMKAMKEKGMPASRDRAFLSVAVLASNQLAISSFIDKLSRADRALLNCLPTERTIDPAIQKALVRNGVSLERCHQLGVLMTILDEVAASVEPSIVAKSLQ